MEGRSLVTIVKCRDYRKFALEERIEHWIIDDTKGAILSAIIAGAFSWPPLQNTLSVPLALIQLAWFSSLIFSIAAVAVAVHQSVFISRISLVPTASDLILEVFSYKTADGKIMPRQTIAFVLLLSVGLLDLSIGFWMAGFMAYLWDITKMRQQTQISLDIVVRELFFCDFRRS